MSFFLEKRWVKGWRRKHTGEGGGRPGRGRMRKRGGRDSEGWCLGTVEREGSLGRVETGGERGWVKRRWIERQKLERRGSEKEERGGSE